MCVCVCVRVCVCHPHTPQPSPAPVDALKRELVWKLKALSCNDDTLQEEVGPPKRAQSCLGSCALPFPPHSPLPQLRHLEAHCTPCVHDALFEQAVIHVWRMVFSHLVERDGGSTASGSSAEVIGSVLVWWCG